MQKQLDQLHLATADVGSLPLKDDFEGERKNFDRAVLDKMRVGLDYPCCPQLPGSRPKPMNMGLQFLIPLSRHCSAIKISGEDAELLSDEIEIPLMPIGAERAEYFVNYLREQELLSGVRGLKVCVTGPFTLASYLNRKNLMTCGASKAQVVRSLAHVLGRTCERLNSLGFDLISIDEPFLSIMLGRKVMFNYDDRFVVEVLDLVVSRISGFSAVHVCGMVTPLVKKVLLECGVNVLDHEFSGTPANLYAYSREDLEQHEKFLAYGCVSSVKTQVETIDEISKSIRDAINLFGPRIIVKPDCGFGGMLGIRDAYGFVLKKLENMVKAARLVSESR